MSKNTTIPTRKNNKSPAPNLKDSPPSGVTVTSTANKKKVSLWSYVQSKELASQVIIGQFVIPNLQQYSQDKERYLI